METVGWESVRHQVAIAGCVRDIDGNPVEGVSIRLTNVPKRFSQWLRGAVWARDARGAQIEERPDRVLSRPDGIFYFLDLPEGEYAIAATAPYRVAEGEKGSDSKTVDVKWDREGRVNRAVADFRLAKKKDDEVG